MEFEIPGAVPEIPVSDLGAAVSYYERQLGFTLDWGGENGGIAGMSQGSCRLFLSDPAFRERRYGNTAPVLIWLNLGSKVEVDALHERWSGSGAQVVARPESKSWKLHEFTVADPDGNLFRVFYDFAWEMRGE
jgi:predicted lactoylglutathione lyase